MLGDLILAEVLRGFRDARGFNEARRMLGRLSQESLCGEELAVEAARNCHKLRARGVAVRGTIDMIIATRCLADSFWQLHNDRDFDPFETHLGLQVVACGAPGTHLLQGMANGGPGFGGRASKIANRPALPHRHHHLHPRHALAQQLAQLGFGRFAAMHQTHLQRAARAGAAGGKVQQVGLVGMG